MSREQIKKQINSQIPHLKTKYHIKKLGIFGSVARGEQNRQSDVDILVEFSAPIGLFDFMDVEQYLAEVLGKKVDLVTKRALKPIIKDEILKETIYV